MESHSRPKPRLPGFSLHLWLALLICALAAGTTHAAPVPTSVVVWGQLFDGSITPPPATEGHTIAIAAADQTLMALLDDGSVVCWGSNASGQLNVPQEASHNITAISAGYQHCLALNSEGRVIAWGDNTYDQSNVPLGAQSGVIQIAAGGTHSLALKSDGSVVAWGNNYSAQSTPPAEAPSGITRISAGKNHSLAITKSGAVIAWGNSHYHQCAVPPAALSGVVAISAGGFHSLALKSDGSLVEWGTTSDLYREGVPSGISGQFAAVSTGTYYNLALGTDRTLVNWSIGGSGAPIPPELFPKRFSAIAAGRAFVMGLMDEVAPVFAQFPAAQTLVEGTSLTLTNSVFGKVLSLQWQKNGVNIPGATNLSLTRSPVELSDAGSYSLIASNTWGSTTSAPPAVVTVTPMPPPAIVTSPKSVTSYDSLSLTFSVQATGNLLSYQWRKDGVDLVGATSPILDFPSLRASDTGSYTVVVSNRRGAATNTPAAYLLVLNSLPPTIVTPPLDTTVAAGSTLKLTVQAAGLPLQYQWFKDGVAIPNATNATFLRIRSSLQNAGDYTVVVSTPKGSDTSAPPARVIITPAPVLPVLTGGVFDPTDELPVPAEAQKGVVSISSDNGLLPSNDYHERLALLQDGSVMAWGGKQLRVDVSQYLRVRKSTHAGKTKLPGAVSGIFASSGDVFLMTSGTIIGASPTAPGVSLIPTSDDTAYVALEGNNPKQSISTRDHLVALRNNGTVVELNGSFEPPVTARSGVLAIAAGNTFTVALRTDGAAVAWEFPTGAALPMDPVFGAKIRAIAADTNGFAGIRVDGSMVFQRLDGSALTLPAPSDGVLASGTPSFALTTDHRALTWDGTRWQPADVPNWTQGRILAHSGSLLLLKEGAPIIQRQPSGASLRLGRSLDLSVDGGGPGARYQWFKSGVAIPGATTQNPHFGLANDASAGSYTVVISNAVGSITSAPPAVVTVLPAPLSGFSRAVSSDGSETPLTTVQVERSYDHSLYLYPEGLVASTFDHSLTYTNYLGDAYHDSRDFGQWIVPTAALSGVVEIHADDFGGSLARKADGTIIYWGGGLPYGKALISPSSNIQTIEGGYRTWFINNDGGIVRWDWDRNIFTQDGVPEAARSGVKSLLAGFFGGALKTDGSLIPLGSGAIPADAQSGIVAFAIARGSNFQHHSPVWAKADGSLFAWSNEGFQETIQRFAAKIPNVTQISTTQTFFDAVNQPPNFMVVRTSDGKAYYVKANDPNPKPVQIPPGWEGRIVSFDVDPAATVITAILRDIPRPQSIQFSLPGSIPFGPSATSLTSTSASGLPVRFTVVEGPASIVDGVLQVTGLGTIHIAADQEGNFAYQPAPRVIQSISVLPGLQITDSTGTPGLSVTLPSGQTAVLERGDLLGPWSPVLNLTGLGAGTPVEIPFPSSDTATPSSFWRVRVP